MKKNNLLILILLFNLIPLIAINREINNGWLGPNASLKFDSHIIDDLYSQIKIDEFDIILFDDYSYLFLRNKNNEKMPITYTKLYAEHIPNLVNQNIKYQRAIAFTRIEFINELGSLKNQLLEISVIKCKDTRIGQYCLTIITPYK
jgi:hypothetical protein